MKPIAQSNDFSVCLKGYTLPKYSIYGNVYGTLYYCTDFCTKAVNGKTVYMIHVYCPNRKNPNRGSWKLCDTLKYGAIFQYMDRFIKSDAFIDKPVEKCEHRTHNKAVMKKAAERAERDHRRAQERARREWYEENMMDAPKERRPQVLNRRGMPTGGSIDYEYTSGLDISGYVGVDGVKYREKYNAPMRFEMGQTTSGDFSAVCPYTRSGFETKDGMKTRFDKYRPENNRPKYTPGKAEVEAWWESMQSMHK